MRTQISRQYKKKPLKLKKQLATKHSLHSLKITDD